MAAVTEDLIDRLGAAAKEARDLIRDCHAATKDLRTAIREGRELLAKEIAGAVGDRIDAQVSEGLTAYQDSLAKALETTDAGIQRRYDELCNIMLYGNKQGRGSSIVDEELERRGPAAGRAADTFPGNRDYLGPDTQCPFCGSPINGHTQHGGKEGRPEPGDASVCAYCAQIAVYTAELGLRRPSDEERVELLSHPAVQDTIRQVAHGKGRS